MSFAKGLAYVLRHCWLWPLEFWLRPLDVIDRGLSKRVLEMVSAFAGGALWGALLSIVADKTYAIWTLAAAFASVTTFAFAFALAGVVAAGIFAAIAVAGAIVVSAFVGSAVADAGASVAFTSAAVASIFAVAGAGVSTGTVANDSANIGIYLYFLIASVLTVALAFLSPTEVPLLLLVCWAVLVAVILLKKRDSVSVIGLVMIVFLCFAVSILFFGDRNFAQTSMYGFVLTVPPVFGGVAGFSSELKNAKTALNIRNREQISKNWLLFFWIVFVLLALVIGFQGEKREYPQPNDNGLAVFLFLVPPLFTLLFFWPVFALRALWQFRRSRAKCHTPKAFAATQPFRLQSFAYYLPGLRHYLVLLCQAHGSAIAMQAIQATQFGSLQTNAARQAAFDLASAPDTALPFCGLIALSTNSATLAPCSLASPAARAVAVLAGKPEQEGEQALRLYITDYPPRFSSQSERLTSSWYQIENLRSEALQNRVVYALRQLDAQPEAAQAAAFREYLDVLLRHINSDFSGIVKVAARMGNLHSEDAPWLRAGWEALRQINAILGRLAGYEHLSTPASRREFIQAISDALNSLQLDGLKDSQFADVSGYWQSIGKELVEIWIERLDEEARQAREWLKLEITFSTATTTIGQQSIQFEILNPTQTLAQNIRIRLNQTEGLVWRNAETGFTSLEGGRVLPAIFDCEARQEGSHRVSGTLEAEDLAGNLFRLPFAFQLNVAHAGKAYQLSSYQPYIIGEGLGDDHAFSGREKLLHWLRGLWLRPGGKPAVVLTGQRRIGKTSLLNKIQRDGLPGTGLLPVYVNVQGLAGEYDFLHSVAREMAAHLAVLAPVLDKTYPYPDFKDFLLGLKLALAGRRFLLMLDEADLIPQRHLGDLLPGFLRALMQEPQYPTLLLFCGTHALKHMSWDYSSILFNTAQFQTVSYMDETESAEVLEKPSRGLLEFDPAALAEAYRLTRGQPLLLQSIGAALINAFDAVVLDGGERSNYVNLNDLRRAADCVAQSANAAFEQHWADSDNATHRVLSTLAWATDETSRQQLDLPGIEARAAELRLTVADGMAFKIAERLADEEILMRQGPTYRFAVPLYRRWVAWRWPPDLVRAEGAVGRLRDSMKPSKIAADNGLEN